MTRHTFRRTATVGLLAGPVLFTLGDLLRRLVEPAGSPSAVDLTRAVGDHPALWLSAGLLSLLAAPLLVAGVLGLVADTHGRGARTTTVGGVMVAVGGFASIGHAVAFYAPYGLYDRAGTPEPAVRALDHASESYPLLVALIALFVVGMMLGSVVLLVGLRLASRVPVWSVVSAVVFVAAGSSGGVAAGVVGVVAAVVAFGPAARSLSRPSATVSAGSEQGGVTLPA